MEEELQKKSTDSRVKSEHRALGEATVKRQERKMPPCKTRKRPSQSLGESSEGQHRGVGGSQKDDKVRSSKEAREDREWTLSTEFGK